MSTPATDSVFDDFDDAQDYVIVARVGDRVRIVSSGRLEAVFVDRSGAPGATVPEDAAEVGVIAAGFGGVIVRPRGRGAAAATPAPEAAAPVSAPTPAPAAAAPPVTPPVAPPVVEAPAYSAFVPPSIDSSLIGAPAPEESVGESVGEPAGQPDETYNETYNESFGETYNESSGDAASNVGQDSRPTDVQENSADEDDDFFDESTSSGIDSSTHERIPTFASAPVAEPQLPAERVQSLDEVPDFDAIMNGETVIDPRDAQPEDDGVSALAGLFDPSPASAPTPAQFDAYESPYDAGPDVEEPADDDLDGEFGPGETEAYDRAWSPSVMPGVSDYTPLERAEPAPVSDDEDRIEETIVRGDPLLRSIADAPEENLAAATLVLSTGERLPITGTILIGRSPSILYAYGDEPRLVTLDVGMTDISRNHLEVRLDGDQVLMRDMGSTNGTLLTRAGTPTVRLPSEAPIVGFPGDVFELGGALTVTIVGV
ncbi:FHA domain-containing protein [Naasia lichenicola]|uniref:FHA domain-containing protein n=1 Tax=Naasia lichenicola TaxID=2565933 RepID=A0A4S4FU19_9MICO|nr:FHA domain-containing protein [Naasia lichenicola]THG33492.1 FHA domain-containing protein [Naasia lichenicola]